MHIKSKIRANVHDVLNFKGIQRNINLPRMRKYCHPQTIGLIWFIFAMKVQHSTCITEAIYLRKVKTEHNTGVIALVGDYYYTW